MNTLKSTTKAKKIWIRPFQDSLFEFKIHSKNHILPSHTSPYRPYKGETTPHPFLHSDYEGGGTVKGTGDTLRSPQASLPKNTQDGSD